MRSSDNRKPSSIPVIQSVSMEIMLPRPTFQQSEPLIMGRYFNRLRQIEDPLPRITFSVPNHVPISNPLNYLAWIVEPHIPCSNRHLHRFFAHRARLNVLKSLMLHPPNSLGLERSFQLTKWILCDRDRPPHRNLDITCRNLFTILTGTTKRLNQ